MKRKTRKRIKFSVFIYCINLNLSKKKEERQIYLTTISLNDIVYLMIYHLMIYVE